MNHSFLIPALAIAAFCLGACNPIEELQSEIRRAGYIPYQNPMAFSGTGTVVGALGGKASQLAFMSPPESCFPEVLPDGTPTLLRMRDETALPSRNRVVTTGFDVNVKVLQGLSSANGTLTAGADFKHVEKMEISFEGAHIDYIDSVKLEKFYREQMLPECKAMLENLAFIVQALEADKMSFRFYRKDGGTIAIDTANIKGFIDISADLEFGVEDATTLVITTPKYLGYQLGKIQRVDGGRAYYRSARTKADDTFDWQSIALFGATAPGAGTEAESTGGISSEMTLRAL